MRAVLRRWLQPAGPGQPEEGPGQPGDAGLPGDDGQPEGNPAGAGEDGAEAVGTVPAGAGEDGTEAVGTVPAGAGEDGAGADAAAQAPAGTGTAADGAGQSPATAQPGAAGSFPGRRVRAVVSPLVSRLGGRARAVVSPVATSRLGRRAQAAAARAATWGRGFSRLTLVPAVLVIAWLLPAIPLLLGGSFELAPMLVISIPLALVLVVVGLRRVPERWPVSAQVKAGLGAPAPLWALLATVAVAAGFTAWQIVMKSQALIVTRDPGVYLQFGYWIAQHGSTSIPAAAAAFGGAHPGLTFGSTGFVQHAGKLTPQFLAGLPTVLSAGFWAGGTGAALLVPPVLGGLAVLTFGGLTGRLAGPRWAPAGALVLALALPEQYTSRSAFTEPLTQVLLFGGLCLLIDSLSAPPAPPARPSIVRQRWGLAGPPSPATTLAALGGLALGLTAVVRVDGLSDALPAIPLIGIMFVGRRPQWIPFGAGLAVGAGYGLADGYLLARPFLDSLSSWTGPFGILAAGVALVTLDAALVWRYAGLGRFARRVLATRPLRWLPEAVAALAVLILIGFGIRPYVQTVRGTNPAVTAYVGYLQRVAGLPLDPRRLYAEDTLYWVIWYIGLPALLLGVFGFAVLARRVMRALVTWSDPGGTARLWALPLLIMGWVTVTVLWLPGISPDQPWASRRLVPVVLPGLILTAVWAAAWLTGRAAARDAGKLVSSAVAVLCVAALLLPTTLTTFGIGVTGAGHDEPRSPGGGLALQPTGLGEAAAVRRLCASIGPGASVVIVDPRVASEFTQLIRGMCDVPVARMDRPSAFAMQPVLTGIETAHRRPVLLGADRAEVGAYGTAPREVLSLNTTQDAHVLTHPPTSTWPARFQIWLSQPS